MKPIVVSTLRPRSTAASDDPPPRWHDTSRSVVGTATERAAALRVVACSWLNPWKPYRRRPSSSHWYGPPYARAASGMRGVERGVETGDLRDVGQLRRRGADAGETGVVVERCELGERVDLGDDVGVDDDRFDEPRAAVDDAVPDGR